MNKNQESDIATVVHQTNSKKGIVIYTDGSSRPAPTGFIGWGVHGYLYEFDDLKKPLVVEENLVTDKGYLDVNSRSDGGIPVVPLKYLDFLGSSMNIGTNNLAEIKALSHALERLAEYGVGAIHVLTDSEYVRNGVTDWCKKWERNNWRKADGLHVANHEWWMRLYEKIKTMRESGTLVTVEWVKAHNGNLGNTRADILSVIGMNYSTSRIARNEFTISDPKGYWKNEAEKHPFINFKRVYFNSVERFNVKGHYFQADPGGGDFVIGKRIPETGFSVVRLKEHEQVIEAVKDKQYEVANDVNAIVMMKLERVYSKEVYPYLATHGKYSLLRSSKANLNLNFIDDKPFTPITVEVNPTGLSLRALESFNLLEDLLNRFVQYKEVGFSNSDNNIQLNSHDITDVFYDKEEKIQKNETQTRYALKPEFVVGIRDIMIKVQETQDGVLHDLKVPLMLGTDLIPRNSLKKLEDHKPSIYLITWRESSNSIRYATVIECDSGIGIWSNFFADKIFFNK